MTGVGIAPTHTRARQRALEDLSSQLSQSVSSECIDQQSDQKNGSFFQCNTRTRTQAKIVGYEIAKEFTCAGHSISIVRLDRRSLTQRLPLTHFTLAPSIIARINTTQRFPYFIFQPMSSDHKIPLRFDPELSLWQVGRSANSVQISTRDLLRSIDWEGCTDTGQLILHQDQLKVKLVQARSLLNIVVKTPYDKPYITLLNRHSGLVFEVLLSHHVARDSSELSIPVETYLLPGQATSHESYIVVFSTEAWPVKELTDRSGEEALLALLQYLAREDVSACASPLTITS